MTRDQIAAWGHDDQTRVLVAVLDCPARGGVLGHSMQREGCNCGELSACGVGKGKVPGQVTFTECLACRAALLGIAFNPQ